MPASIRLTIYATLLLTLLCACASTPEPASAPMIAVEQQTSIGGVVRDATGAPAVGSVVYAYRNARSNLRGPADFESKVNAAGAYALDLVAGDYYLIARLRQSGADSGPPRPGDAWALPADNPVTVAERQSLTVDFTLLGVSQPMLMRQGTLTGGDTGFTGLLLDERGEPV
ncbi:MAG: carboxypeptidase-like regulatory domain-containing protein, partial [Desulfuromonadales bacterium]|nr:carboxypeptidase-like regulatory domain-containing protein [Desulfuromonadales bacterium]